ncbi:MAG: P-II family nitrogen regulator [Oscillospiraceae bacterium]|jgi:nitrogen regulatory protein PII|nr:P-II family nitrogen regulator [Oscillospiraceae bacterium]
MADFEILCCVVNHGQGSRALRLAKRHGARGGTIFLGAGTVKNRLLEALDIFDVRKEILFIAAEQALVPPIMEGLAAEMAFHKHGRGIAFSMPLCNFIGTRHCAFSAAAELERRDDDMHQAIFVVVDKGCAEETVEAAKAAGARGGTIISARGSGIHETEVLFAMPVEPEKEIVMILVEAAQSESIVESIRARLHIDEPGNGILFTLGVNRALGLR